MPPWPSLHARGSHRRTRDGFGSAHCGSTAAPWFRMHVLRPTEAMGISNDVFMRFAFNVAVSPALSDFLMKHTHTLYSPLTRLTAEVMRAVPVL